jgi:hypothetical protein
MGRIGGQGGWYCRDGALTPLVALSALAALLLQQSGTLSVSGVVPNLMLALLLAWVLAGVSLLTLVAALALVAVYAFVWMPFGALSVAWYLGLVLIAAALRPVFTTYRVFDVALACVGAQLISWTALALRGLPYPPFSSQGVELVLNFAFAAMMLPLALAARTVARGRL